MELRVCSQRQKGEDVMKGLAKSLGEVAPLEVERATSVDESRPLTKMTLALLHSRALGRNAEETAS